MITRWPVELIGRILGDALDDPEHDRVDRAQRPRGARRGHHQHGKHGAAERQRAESLRARQGPVSKQRASVRQTGSRSRRRVEVGAGAAASVGLRAVARTWKLEFPYRRSVGPVIGAFLTGLRDRARRRRAHRRRAGCSCPPFEYDPETGEARRRPGRRRLARASSSTRRGSPSRCARIRSTARSRGRSCSLDGADTPLLHALDCGSADARRSRARACASAGRAETDGPHHRHRVLRAGGAS